MQKKQATGQGVWKRDVFGVLVVLVVLVLGTALQMEVDFLIESCSPP